MSTLLAALLVHMAQLSGGSLGWAIVALSIGIRCALLPLTIRLSRRMIRNQEIARAMQSEIDELKRRFEKRPERLLPEIQKLYKKHGYSPFDLPAMLGSFAQWPIFGLLYRAIQKAVASGGPFLWIKSLRSADALLTLMILAMTAASAYFFPNASENAKSGIVVVQVVVTGLIVWKLAAGLGLYWASSGLVGLGQTLWLRYGGRQHARPA